MFAIFTMLGVFGRGASTAHAADHVLPKPQSDLPAAKPGETRTAVSPADVSGAPKGRSSNSRA